MMDRQTFDQDVSRETLDRLKVFAALLTKWNPAINLVAKSTIPTLWSRHIADSKQVFDLVPTPKGTWVDLGSGGGLPGIVLAILAAEKSPELSVHLVESDKRKATFLRTALRETGVSATVHAHRIEEVSPLNADILSARALTDLTGLLGMARRHLKPGGTCLFPKGESWQSEVEHARTKWSFSLTPHRSKTESKAVILQIGELTDV